MPPRLRTLALYSALVLALSVSPLVAGGIGIVGTELRDNGDDDGFADTLETVELRPTIQNSTGFDLTDVALRLSTSAPEITCIRRPVIAVGDLGAGEVRRLDGTFMFTVADVDRNALGLDELGNLSVTFEVSVFGEHLGEPAIVPTMGLDLDLDVSGGSGSTSFFEDFESGTLASFVVQNFDSRLTNLSTVDGYRCQLSDPDWVNSNAYAGGVTDCFLGVNQAQADAVHWQIDGPGPQTGWPGRGFSGASSLYYGVELDPSLGHTTPHAVLESAALQDPVNLSWERTCEGDPTTSCSTDVECLPGSPCVMVLPELSIKHQVSLYYRRPSQETLLDRAVVQAQLADEMGQPVGPWIKIVPYQNTYSSGTDDGILGACSFDPIDDGNTEDDFFDPTDPARRLGPSSTCHPERVFGGQGETFSPFDATLVGFGDGPGLLGESGLGTWVESRFDLSRFRGRRIRVRFLVSSLQAGAGLGFPETWEQTFNHNPDPFDDGWWIDDVTVEGALTTPASLTSDTTDNSLLPGLDDTDDDGAIDACDPCPTLADSGWLDADGDGWGDSCDNCPAVFNASQDDRDADTLGDACDPCPTGETSDDDADGVVCSVDNCPLTSNPDGLDRDADGLGDACDPCPLDAANDADGDGLCLAADNCPTLFNPEQTGIVRLVELQRLGQVTYWPGATDWAYSPDSSRIVYIADQVIDEEFGLYSVPLSGGASTRLGIPGPFEISPDGASVLYVAAEESESLELFRVPIDGGERIRLSGDMVPGGNVSDAYLPAFSHRPAFEISPDGSTVVYVADQDTDGVFELYGVPIGGGTPVKLSGPLVPEGDVWDFRFSLDGSTIVYRADAEANGREEIFSVPVLGGPVTKLNHTLTPGEQVDGVDLDGYAPFAITADSNRVIYWVDRSGATPGGLYSVPIGGGTATALHPPLESTTVRAEVSPDGLSVAFYATLPVDGEGLFLVPSDGGAPPSKIASRDITFSFSPRGDYLVYKDRFSDLYSVAVGGGTPVLLWEMAAESPTWVISPDDSHVVVIGRGAGSQSVSSVPIIGGPLTLLADDVFVADPVITPDSSALLFRSEDPAEITADYFNLVQVPITGGDPVEVNDPLPPQGQFLGVQDGVLRYRLSPDGKSVTYLARQFLSDRFDLTAKSLDVDSDGDGLLFFCDTCPAVSNALQTDSDADLLGDVCDNCRWDPNVDQFDFDLDGAGDVCDCAPTDADARSPSEVTLALTEKPVAGSMRLLWDATDGADAYAVSRTPISQLTTNQFGPCVEPSLEQTWYEDPETPPIHDGFAYLIQGVDFVCGHGTPGPGVGGAERSNLDPQACP